MLVRPVTGYLPPIRAVARRPWRAVGRLRERAWQPAVGRLAARAVGPRCVPVPLSAVRGGRVGRGVREGGVAPNGRGPSPVSRPRSGGRAWACALGGARTLLHPGPRCCGPGVAPGRVWPCPPPVSPCGCAGGPRLPRRRRHSAPADFFIAARRRPSHRPRRVGSVLRLLAVALAAPARRRPTRRPRRRPPPWWRRRRCCTCTRLPALPAGAPVAADAPCCRAAPSPDDGGGGTRVYTPRR